MTALRLLWCAAYVVVCAWYAVRGVREALPFRDRDRGTYALGMMCAAGIVALGACCVLTVAREVARG